MEQSSRYRLALAIVSLGIALGVGTAPWGAVSTPAWAATITVDPSAAACSNSNQTDNDHGAVTGWTCAATKGATPAQLTDLGSGDNSAAGRVNLEADDTKDGGKDALTVSFVVPEFTGPFRSVTIRVWSSASDDPGTLMVGNTLSAWSRYGSATPGEAVEYSNGNLDNDFLSVATLSSLTVRLRMSCPGSTDCGALVDKVELVIAYGPDDPPPPPPPLPAVAKAAADLDFSTPGDQSLDATRAYWDVTIDNAAAGAIDRDGIVVTEGFADAVLESVTPAGSCGSLATTGPWTCDVAAGGTTVLRVSRPRSALADACSGGTLPNFVASATLSDLTPLEVTAGNSTSPIDIPVPSDVSACPLPTVRLVARDPALASGYALWDIVIDQPEAGGIARTVTLSLAHEAGIEGQQPPASCAPAGAAFTCQAPTGDDVVLTVRRAVTEENLATGSLCNGGTIAENLAGAVLSDGTPLTITEGASGSPVLYPVQDTSACAPPSLSKTLVSAGEAVTTDPAAVAWQLTISNHLDPRRRHGRRRGPRLLVG